MEQIELDSIDLHLLEELQSDASQSNQALAERIHVSPPTCLRRIKRLRDAGLIERQIAILDADLLAQTMGHGLSAIIEVTLDRQGDDYLVAFEACAGAESLVQQCYRVSPGPDFILIVHTHDMPDYLDLARRLFTSNANVRNVKAFFSIKRSKFEPAIALRPRSGP